MNHLQKTKRNKVIKNQPWWPYDLERVPNSSRHSLEDPGLNPARVIILYGIPPHCDVLMNGSHPCTDYQARQKFIYLVNWNGATLWRQFREMTAILKTTFLDVFGGVLERGGIKPILKDFC